jgi:hypothetical protein
MTCIESRKVKLKDERGYPAQKEGVEVFRSEDPGA